MALIPCPLCSHRVPLRGRIRLGRIATCRHCCAYLEVVSLHPLKLAKSQLSSPSAVAYHRRRP